VLCLKANHPTLWAEATAWFKQAEAVNFAGLEHSYDQREDKSRLRRGHGGENMALLRRLAISVLNQETQS
jgi:predicted transposase YbfD/YdcC